ncbi:chemotaxis protein CheW [Pedomonas mirosovicensis]|uniref:chemotaxis protein CheW n=1 Tax=Pedomonas mirosovicensis TaxID=2908641 RepID=UPI0021682054|nr:chemotaxis protein CheW [Pedomonas mirosovicensis]MCH8686728.1 chemotaxis protein CheW [Pedomonas mirosovicensis]
MTDTTSSQGATDWQRLRQRLARASEAVEAAFEPSTEHAKECLEKRASALAQPLRREEDVAEGLEVVTWRVMTDRFALETAYVREIAKVRDLTIVPRTPSYLAGICNVRGEILPAFDLRKLFDFTSQGLSDLSYVIVVGREMGEFGILADSVERVIRVPSDAIVANQAFATGGTCVRGMTADALVILDGAALLAEPALFISG